MIVVPKSVSKIVCATVAVSAIASSASLAATVTDPNDARNWQGATVGTFASLFYGADTLANRQLIVDNELLDDGVFNFAGATGAEMVAGGGTVGYSTDLTGTGSLAYNLGGATAHDAASTINNFWVQTSGTIGVNVWDLGAPATKAAIFNTIDHGPLPQEAIESTVYLSNDMVTWTQAVTEKVWLEGFMTLLGIKWDGFTYAVGTGTNATFRYASIIWGGPGALISDGDNEINGVMGLDANFNPTTPSAVPLPAALPLLVVGLGGLGLFGRRKKKLA
jgi:hypothetical protein